MDSINLESDAFTALKNAMDFYAPISHKTWQNLRTFCKFKILPKHHILYPCAEVPKSFAFVHTGLFRVFTSDHDGGEYNKKFFDAGSFPGSMTALLTSSPSQFTVESLEPSSIVIIDFGAYRKLLLETDDLNYLNLSRIFFKQPIFLQIINMK